MSTTYVTAALAAASLAAALAGGAPAQAQPGFDTTLARSGDAQLILAQNRTCYGGERLADCRERLRFEQRDQRRYQWRDGRYQDDRGGVVTGTILGFALGSAIAGSRNDHAYYYSHRHNRRWRNDCRDNYQGWDSRSGTYLGNDGYRHYCIR